MSKNNDNNKVKLENYLAYGMCFGLLGGVLLFLVGMISGNFFIQITGAGIGLSAGILIGVLFYSLKNSK